MLLLQIPVGIFKALMVIGPLVGLIVVLVLIIYIIRRIMKK